MMAAARKEAAVVTGAGSGIMAADVKNESRLK